jgi:cyclopropane-fatty-acyl-phospholipid synthase
MGLAAKSLQSRTVRDDRAAILRNLLADYPQHDFQIRLWDGFVWGAETTPRFALVINSPRALSALYLSPNELSLGESYVRGDFEIEGDLEAAFDLADHLLQREVADKQRDLLKQLIPLAVHEPGTLIPFPVLSGHLHSRERDLQVVTYHYNLPSEFYGLWLDARMVYSCAYFQTPTESLDMAQQHKLEYLCRKLRLRRGDRLLDIGCGWGSLVLYAAAEHGAQVLGITLSERQAAWARRQIRALALDEQCRVEVCDYRDLPAGQQYDKVVSVGMFEHVGEANLPDYFRRALEMLRPGGVFLNHGIAYSTTYHRRGPSFTDRYVFPDGDLVPISTTLRAAEQTGFEVRDVENLREHYALTLQHWLARLESRADEARRLVGDVTYRIYRIYLAGSAHAFLRGRLGLYQTLLAKPVCGESRLPLTREDWYRAWPSS